MFNVLGVDIYYNKYLTKVNVCDDLLTHYESVHYEERNFDNEFLLIEIEELIDKCISENRKYEYKVILKPKSIEDLEDFEKKLYIPYSKNSNNSYIPTNIGISNLKQEPIDKIEEDKKYISANNNEGTDENVSVEIIAIENNLSKKQVNSLVKGLVSLDCIDNDSKDDMLAFLGNKTKTPINKIDWKKTKILCAYFVDKFNSDILNNDRIKWKPFESLFSIRNLIDSRNYYSNKTGELPRDHEIIDDLFKKILDCT